MRKNNFAIIETSGHSVFTSPKEISKLHVNPPNVNKCLTGLVNSLIRKAEMSLSDVPTLLIHPNGLLIAEVH